MANSAPIATYSCYPTLCYKSPSALPRGRGKMRNYLQGMLLVRDPALKLHETIEHRFRPRRAAGDVNIHRYDSIDPLHRGVVVIKAAAGGASPECHDPPGFRHLLINSL